jgi:hypothetical protein
MCIFNPQQAYRGDQVINPHASVYSTRGIHMIQVHPDQLFTVARALYNVCLVLFQTCHFTLYVQSLVSKKYQFNKKRAHTICCKLEITDRAFLNITE